MSSVHIYEDIQELNRALDSAEEKTAISDDAFREAVAKIFYKPSLLDIPQDPFSTDYRHRQFELYETITARTVCGGYTTIGTVIKSDLDLIAQASPGCQIHFDEVGIEQALQARRDREARLSLIRMELGIFDQAGALGQ